MLTLEVAEPLAEKALQLCGYSPVSARALDRHRTSWPTPICLLALAGIFLDTLPLLLHTNNNFCTKFCKSYSFDKIYILQKLTQKCICFIVCFLWFWRVQFTGHCFCNGSDPSNIADWSVWISSTRTAFPVRIKYIWELQLRVSGRVTERIAEPPLSTSADCSGLCDTTISSFQPHHSCSKP